MSINWKTTTAGILVGLIPILQGTADALNSGGSIHWYPTLLGFGLMILGILAKDAK